MHVFNKVTFIHASRVQERVIKTDQNNKRTHIFKGWEGQKHGKKKTKKQKKHTNFKTGLKKVFLQGRYTNNQ